MMLQDERGRGGWLSALVGRSLLLGLLGPVLAGCQLSVLDTKGPVGAGERVILLNAVVIMLCIIVPTIIATLAFAWWFRAGNPRARRLPKWNFSGRIEIVVWSVPLLTIMFLGAITWISSHDLDPAKPLPTQGKPLEVQVVSLDWKWLFIYPEQKVASVNQLVLPVGRPVHFALTSASVWNSFFVPGLGSMIYTMNGMATELNLQADRPGSFHGLSTHLSGDGFAGMHFDTVAMGADAFQAWVTQAQGAKDALDQPGYLELAKQSTNNPVATYRLADPDLFTKLVSQAIPPSPGPHNGAAPNVTPKGGS